MADTEFDYTAFHALVDSAAPLESVRPAPDRYAPLDPKAEGSWSVVRENGLRTAVVWTDWNDAFGVITIRPGATATRLHEYVTNAKATQVPAGWAYTTLELFVKRFENTTVSLSPKSEGKLQGAWRDAAGVPKEEVVR